MMLKIKNCWSKIFLTGFIEHSTTEPTVSKVVKVNFAFLVGKVGDYIFIVDR